MKVAAGGKGDLLAAVAGSLPSCEGILEIGTYCGYSALRMADASSSARITTLEVDPFHMLVARHIVAFAGLAGRVEVRCLHSKDGNPLCRAIKTNLIGNSKSWGCLSHGHEASFLQKNLESGQSQALPMS